MSPWALVAYFWLTTSTSDRDMRLANCTVLEQKYVDGLGLKRPTDKPGKICIRQQEHELLKRGRWPNYKTIYIRQ